ncbi:BamA/TamA family outer membrane protein [Carboxylicivirga marina]|uniref:BamA/TamA family outer membrane protein n=1 Tax=Carboxylicivirga marina TaxID=2800988 RepID=A0ABS1HQ94_9BACT|nr:BamA/TamA family outer membrane protein [Carboxylicivirga marina]MBK3519660.1 BamA/TamA family outer membrane protein [Carboxylicivirga marina]
MVNQLLNKYHALLKAMTCFLLLTASTHVSSQDTTNVFVKTLHNIDSLVTESLSSEGGIVPAPMFNPTMGTGIAVLPVYVYRIKGTHPETNPSTSQGILFFNFTGSFLAGAKQTLYFNRNKFWLDAYVGYASMTFENYIKGSDKKETVQFKGFVSNVSFAFKVKEHFFLGPIMSNSYLLEELSEQFGSSGDNDNFYWYHVPGLKVSYDSRDNLFYPESGWFSSLSYETLIHNPSYSYNFDKIILGISNYQIISKDKSKLIATRFFGQAGIGKLPLHEMASPGASPILRGYITGNYLNSSMISVQSELRWMFNERWGAVGFAGYGWLFDEPRNIEDNISLPSIGTGVRYRIFPTFKINLGLDVAFGRDGSANVYFKLSESF